MTLEARDGVLALDRERQRDPGGVHREALGRLEAHGRGARVLRVAAHRDAHLHGAPRPGERYRGDVGVEPQRQLRHDRERVPPLAADEAACVAEDRGRPHGRREARDAEPGACPHRGRAPRERLVGRDDELVAIAVRELPPVGLRRAGVGGDRQLEAGRARRAAGASAVVTALDRPAGRRLELEAFDLQRARNAASERHAHAERLPRRHEPVVHARLQHQAVGELERRLDVLLLVLEPAVDLGPCARVVDDARQRAAQRADPCERGRERGRRGLGRARVEGGAGGAEQRLERLELRREGCVRRGEAPQAGERRVDAVQEVGFASRDGRLGVDQAEQPLGRPEIGRNLARALAAVHRARAHPQLLPAHAQQRVVDARRHGHRGILRPAEATDAALVELERLPRGKALLGEPRRVGCVAEGRPRELGGRLVVLATALARERQRQDHVGPKGPDHAHDVAHRRVAAPLREGLLDAEGVAELVGAPEVLLDAVVAVERHELARAQHAERVEQLRPDRVLPAFPARHGEESGAHAEPAREPHQDPVVLVVRVRGHVQHACGRAHAPQRQAEAVRPAVEVEGLEDAGWSSAGRALDGTVEGERGRGESRDGAEQRLSVSGLVKPGTAEGTTDRQADGSVDGWGAPMPPPRPPAIWPHPR